MTNYFVSVIEEKSTWHLATEDFIAAFKRNWPEAAIVSETPDRVRFELNPGHGHGYVYGSLSDGDSVVVEMVEDMRDIVTIAIWFRALVPEGLTVLLFDEGYNEHFSVTPSMTEEELTAVFLPDSSTTPG